MLRSRGGRDGARAGGFRLADQEGGRGEGVVHGAGRNRDPGVDQGVKKAAVARALEIDADDGDFHDAVGRRVEAGGLDVNGMGKSGHCSLFVPSLFHYRVPV